MEPNKLYEHKLYAFSIIQTCVRESCQQVNNQNLIWICMHCNTLMRLVPDILNTGEFSANGPIIMVRSYQTLLAASNPFISAEAEFQKRMVPDIKTLQFRCVLIESDQALVWTSFSLDQVFLSLVFQTQTMGQTRSGRPTWAQSLGELFEVYISLAVNLQSCCG